MVTGRPAFECFSTATCTPVYVFRCHTLVGLFKEAKTFRFPPGLSDGEISDLGWSPWLRRSCSKGGIGGGSGGMVSSMLLVPSSFCNWSEGSTGDGSDSAGTCAMMGECSWNSSLSSSCIQLDDGSWIVYRLGRRHPEELLQSEFNGILQELKTDRLPSLHTPRCCKDQAGTIPEQYQRSHFKLLVDEWHNKTTS